jgi:transposase
MFVKKVKAKSGKTYIQIIDKTNGKSRVVENIGSSYSKREIKRLEEKARIWIDNKLGVQRFDFEGLDRQAERFLQNITGLKLVGLELLLGKIFDEIGFRKITDSIFRHLVIYRLFYPTSKLKTTEYLSRYAQIEYKEDKIYRYLDKLYKEQREQIQQISYEHTKKILGGIISVVFYDVTTLYFQIDDEDDLRVRGFSKEGKHQNPQIVLGLLVSIDGYPLAFEIFEGNKFEAHTMLPLLDRFKRKYNLEKLVIVADSGLLSKKNIEELQSKDYEFILGARIKNESRKIKEKILSLKLRNGESKIIKKSDNLKLLISYYDSRAKKDKHNRERGLKRLEKQLKSGKLTKSNINKRGYNKYLKLEGNISVAIDYEKFEQDGKWDGLKGYITNTSLSKDEIITNYGHLWKIEKAFRIAKHDLRIRPIYHRLRRRIQAHIIINFVAYKVYKELERQLKEKGASLSPEKAIEIAENIYEIEIKIPNQEKRIRKILILTGEQKYLSQLFDFRGVK